MSLKFNRGKHTDDFLIHLYKELLYPRLIEERMLLLLRQGKISKWFSGIGQEAISIGATLALETDEFMLPMHRNLGMFTARKIPLERLFAQFQGKMSGYTKGRDRSFHFGAPDLHIVGMISHLGAQMGLADGIALGERLKKSNKITLVVTGDGGASQGEFHEALNVAAVWQLPVIFVIENNGYGLSTPSEEQFVFKNFIDKGKGYGMEAVQVDGNNVLAVYDAVDKIATAMRKKPRPVILECMTFRMRGHEEASGTKYVPPGLFDEWAKKDPVDNYEQFILKEGLLSKEECQEVKDEIIGKIGRALEIAYAEELADADENREYTDLFFPYKQEVIEPSGDKTHELRLVDAISEGLKQSLHKYDQLVVMGQDIAEYGGVFKVTEGFLDEFGKDRIRNTPLCESAIVGAALGLSIRGFKAVMEMQFADFVTCGFNQIINNLAKAHWRWGQKADVVIRMPTGAGVNAGPFHSQSNEAWFFHTPGLKVVYPAFPGDAKGLLAASIEDPNPVMFFEHKALYRSVKEEVHADYYTTEIGKAKLIREGTSVSIITYGSGVHWALEVLDNNPEISADLIDLRTLMPFDEAAILTSVKKTNRAIILHEDSLIGGIGGELSSFISEHCFEFLDAPVMRSGSLDTPIPFSANLEEAFLPQSRFVEQLKKVLNY
ncbi:MAG: dehydrogenase E1 component subunit alpha/beta [Flavobacteriales bacterium]|nr:dehydrogenase E1 component subunit alpha/beta [Flavobacteriales bacterium]